MATGLKSVIGAQDRGTSNRLLLQLAEADWALLAPHLERVSFAVWDDIARAGERIASVCFLNDGIAGILDALEGDRRYAVALVGAARR